VYIRRSATGRLIIAALFVDDLSVLSHPDDADETRDVINRLSQQIKIKDLGPVSMLLGMRITRDRKRGELTVDVEAFIRRFCDKYGIGNSKKAVPKVPEFVSIPFTSSSSSAASHAAAAQLEAEPNQQLTLENYSTGVGSLGYAALTVRPDIAHVVNQLARQQANPQEEHLKVMLRACHYLLATAPLGLKFSRDSSSARQYPVLTAYTDSDWAGSKVDARSTTGVVLKLAGAAVVWQSSKQPTVALSATESEFISTSEGGRSVVHIRGLLGELGVPQREPTTMFIDNTTAISMAADGGNTDRRKHINVKYHFIRQLVGTRVIQPSWIPTHLQQADIMTKALGATTFLPLRDAVMGHARLN
jgi:hypothetical protein